MVNKLLGQAGMPRGLIGRLFGNIMARHNGPDNEWTIELLHIEPSDRILEVGFGPGAAVESLVKLQPSVHLDGVDHSEAMLQAASSRNRYAMIEGKVSLQLGSVDQLPFEESCFDKAFAINCIYFWERPVKGLVELHRVLKPGGLLGITVRDKARDAYRAFRPERLRKMFVQSGFNNVDVIHNGIPSHPLSCALGVKGG